MHPNNNISPWAVPLRNLPYQQVPLFQQHAAYVQQLQQRSQWWEQHAAMLSEQLNKKVKDIAELENLKKREAETGKVQIKNLEVANKKLREELVQKTSANASMIKALEAENKKLRGVAQKNGDAIKITTLEKKLREERARKTGMESELRKQTDRCMKLEQNNHQLKEEMDQLKQSFDLAIKEAEANSKLWEEKAHQFEIVQRSANNEKNMMQAEYDAVIQGWIAMRAIISDFQQHTAQFYQQINSIMPFDCTISVMNNPNNNIDATATTDSSVPSSLSSPTSKSKQNLLRRSVKAEPREEEVGTPTSDESPILKKARKELWSQVTQMMFKASNQPARGGSDNTA